MHICHNRYNCLGAVLTHRPPHVLVAMTDATEEVKAGVPDEFEAAISTADEALGGAEATLGGGTAGGDDDGDEAMAFVEAETDPTLRSVEECEAILEAAREKNRKRAERFGGEYQEPNKVSRPLWLQAWVGGTDGCLARSGNC